MSRKICEEKWSPEKWFPMKSSSVAVSETLLRKHKLEKACIKIDDHLQGAAGRLV
jgi:hypothetical protein